MLKRFRRRFQGVGGVCGEGVHRSLMSRPASRVRRSWRIKPELRRAVEWSGRVRTVRPVRQAKAR